MGNLELGKMQHGIHGIIELTDFEMEMGTSRVSCFANSGDHLPLLDPERLPFGSTLDQVR